MAGSDPDRVFPSWKKEDLKCKIWYIDPGERIGPLRV